VSRVGGFRECRSNPTRIVVNIQEIVLNIEDIVVNIEDIVLNVRQFVLNIEEIVLSIEKNLLNIEEIFISIIEPIVDVRWINSNVIKVLHDPVDRMTWCGGKIAERRVIVDGARCSGSWLGEALTPCAARTKASSTHGSATRRSASANHSITAFSPCERRGEKAYVCFSSEGQTR
jgi:aubergine-like protein